ncbi:MAG: signal peptidase I [Aigarchaeota archaeon]|nr:signal peptidase I [Aigarchaeota archaeon]MDW8021481.1 signal peptidase I [Nitrososphaerota archaeon]
MKVKTALSTIIVATLLLILAVLAAYRLTGHVTPLLIVKSGSMRPALEVGDVILMEPVRPEELEVGDVIIFHNPISGDLIVHRIVKKTPEGVYTKGDANPGIDWWSPVPYENIVGRWTGFKIPNWTGIGYLSLFLSGDIYPPYGRIVLIILMVVNLYLILRDLMGHRRSRKSMVEGRGDDVEAS